MKLSEILYSRQRLKQLVDSHGWRRAMDDKFVRDSFERPVAEAFGTIEQSMGSIMDMTSEMLEMFDIKAQAQHDRYHALSEEVYEETKTLQIRARSNPILPHQTDWPDEILARRVRMDDDTRDIMETRLRGYTDWRFPALLIRPGRENIVNHMVDHDPLYLMDHTESLLEDARSRFPQQYQIPDTQFGLIVVQYYFNFKTMAIIENYLRDIFIKLRPGGLVAFTLNDCDWAFNTALCESRYACFTPGSLVKQLCVDIGLEPVHEIHTPGEFHWFEFRRPGELQSKRGGQMLAEVHRL